MAEGIQDLPPSPNEKNSYRFRLRGSSPNIAAEDYDYARSARVPSGSNLEGSISGKRTTEEGPSDGRAYLVGGTHPGHTPAEE